MKPFISYAITVCREYHEIKRLVTTLQENKEPTDEIVILYDSVNGSKEVKNYLDSLPKEIKVSIGKFNKNFSEFKNNLNTLCEGDWIFNIDADELPHSYLIKNIPSILHHNEYVDLLGVARWNTVEGITEEHIRKWGWRKDELNRINFPDTQYRIYKNSPDIQWAGKVHERIVGTQNFSNLPEEEVFCLYHPKSIEKQEKQNKLYSEL